MAEFPSAFIPLTEAPPSIKLVKRALISYETVLLAAAEEREREPHGGGCVSENASMASPKRRCR